MRLLIAGGGTGGHLFPGVAVAQELLAQDTDAQVLFVGTERGIESRVLPELGWNLACIEVSGLKTVGLKGALRGALRIPGSLLQSRKILSDFAPDAVLGVGGYASGPVVLAARAMGIPTAILEQNSIPGVTNKILGKVAKRVFLSFAHSQSYFAADKSVLVGNPIRQQILASLQQATVNATQSSEARQPVGASPQKALRLFIFGGSQGAVSVNAMCCSAAALLAQQGIDLEIVHQTGAADLQATQQRYEAAGLVADCRAFIEDMASEYLAADVIVSRAGATTIAELGIVGRPAILIPYPFAANDHQELNAQEMFDAGAAWILRQANNEDGQALAAMLAELCGDTELRQRMSEAMRALGRPDAAAQVVRWLQVQA